ncbi:MAG: hypothetical protein WDM91_13545 [Rhizomicrobium sp.]
MDSLRRFVASAWVAWALVALLAVVVVLSAMGRLRPLPGGDGTDYVAASQQLANGDRAQTPHMRLESQYPGPLQDTTIERWRDPVDNTVCYIYLPIAVAHAPGPAGLVQYGAANIGSISCFKGK